MKLALGTVQFGLNYGVTNAAGQVSTETAGDILALANSLGLRWLDTAAAYGESEQVLGRLLQKTTGHQQHFNICTKTLPIAGDVIRTEDVAAVEARFLQSLKNLGRSRVEILMVHHARNLLADGGDRLFAALQKWQADGLVADIGFSAYDPGEVQAVLARFPFRVLQVPVSVLDQRMVSSGLLQALQQAEVKVFARSIFLQGRLLVRGPSPHAALLRFWQFCTEHAVSPLQATLGFVRQCHGVDHALVGTTTTAELQDIFRAYGQGADLDYSELACDDPDLIDPRRWPTTR